MTFVEFVIFFPPSGATALVNSLVSSSKLDYCNSLYSVISQAKQISTHSKPIASVIINTSKYHNITPTLKKLHWLPIKQRIDYKICLLTYKTSRYNRTVLGSKRIFSEMVGARALVRAPLDRWRFSRHFGISHISMTSAVSEL